MSGSGRAGRRGRAEAPSVATPARHAPPEQRAGSPKAGRRVGPVPHPSDVTGFTAVTVCVVATLGTAHITREPPRCRTNTNNCEEWLALLTTNVTRRVETAGQT